MKRYLRSGWVCVIILIQLLASYRSVSGQTSSDERASKVVDSLWTISEVLRDADHDGKVDAIGQRVKVAGRANVASGLYHERYLQVFIQNDSLGISLFRKSIRQPIQVGDSVVATGVVQRYYGMAEISVDHYLVYSKNRKVPEPIPIQKVVANPDKYVGLLTSGTGVVVGKGERVNGKYLKLALSKGSEKAVSVYVSNFHRYFDQFDFERISIGDDLKITGVVGVTYFSSPVDEKLNNYPILLRKPADMEVIGLSWYYLRLIILGGVLVLALIIIWIVMLRRQVKNQTREIQQSLNEKEALLQEIHHRVKNNLAVISGLIELQLDTTEDNSARQALRDSQTRIQSMAMVHEKLYQSDSLAQIEMESYLRELVETIHYTFDNHKEEISYTVDVDPVKFDLDKAIPCGLLVNELVVNVYKHAFKDHQTGSYKVALKRKNGTIQLKVSDDGPGLPEGFEPRESASLGMSLIDTFVSQLEGTLEIDNRDGASFNIEFKV